MKRNFGFKPYEGEDKYGFISYKSEDEKLVAPYAKALHDNGVKLWYDYGIPAGEDWFQTISQKIVESSFMIVFVTERVFRSSVIQTEIQTAEMWDIPVVPVFLEKIDRQNIPTTQASLYTILSFKQGVDRAWSMSVWETADSVYELIAPMIASDTEEKSQQRGKLLERQVSLTPDINNNPMVRSALSEVREEENAERKTTDPNVITYENGFKPNRTPASTDHRSSGLQKSTVVVNPQQKKLFRDEELAEAERRREKPPLNPHINQDRTSSLTSKNDGLQKSTAVVNPKQKKLFRDEELAEAERQRKRPPINPTVNQDRTSSSTSKNDGLQKSTVVVDPKQKRLFKDEEDKVNHIIEDSNNCENPFLKPKAWVIYSALLVFLVLFLITLPRLFYLYDSPEDYEYKVESDVICITGLANTELTELRIPKKIKGMEVAYIASSAFQNCTGITQVVVPDTVCYIGSEAFRNCVNLTDIYVSGQKTSLSENVFLNCPDVTIHGILYSYAYSYAHDENIPFDVL